MFLERQARPVNKFLCAYIKERQREGAFCGVDPRVAVSAFIGALNHHVMMNAFFEEWRINISDEEAVESYTNLFLNGLRVKSAATKQIRKTSLGRTSPVKNRKPSVTARKASVKAGSGKTKL
jgi:hypothetical protein